MSTTARESVDLELEHLELDSDVHLASLTERKRLWWRSVAINGAFIGSWFFFALILQLYNKWMFSPDRFGFPFPLFVTMLHMFVQWTLAALCRLLWPQRFRSELVPSRDGYLRKATPTAIATGLDIGLSNLSLRTITLSFYTMCKSSTLIFVLIFAFALNLEKFSIRLIGVIFLIFVGVLLMVATETHFVLSGFVLVSSASALGGLRWSLTQVLMRDRQLGIDTPMATIFWLAPVMGVTVGLISLVLDSWPSLIGSHFFDGLESSLRTTFFLVLPGALAFAMVISEYSIIQRAGVVPMSIAGIAKEVATISSAAWFFGDELTPLNIIGVAITVCGIALFTYHKYRKSIDSPVPLDAHGVPLSETDGDTIALESGYHLAPERAPSVHSDDDVPSQPGEQPHNQRIPFSPEPVDEDVDALLRR